MYTCAHTHACVHSRVHAYTCTWPYDAYLFRGKFIRFFVHNSRTCVRTCMRSGMLFKAHAHTYTYMTSNPRLALCYSTCSQSSEFAHVVSSGKKMNIAAYVLMQIDAFWIYIYRRRYEHWGLRYTHTRPQAPDWRDVILPTCADRCSSCACGATVCHRLCTYRYIYVAIQSLYPQIIDEFKHVRTHS
jgi:hypothetical protein